MKTIDEALNSPFKKIKDADREVELASTDELLKRKRIMSQGKRPMVRSMPIMRNRGL
jgi:hypothetical protein